MRRAFAVLALAASMIAVNGDMYGAGRGDDDWRRDGIFGRPIGRPFPPEYAPITTLPYFPLGAPPPSWSSPPLSAPICICPIAAPVVAPPIVAAPPIYYTVTAPPLAAAPTWSAPLAAAPSSWSGRVLRGHDDGNKPAGRGRKLNWDANCNHIGGAPGYTTLPPWCASSYGGGAPSSYGSGKS